LRQGPFLKVQVFEIQLLFVLKMFAANDWKPFQFCICLVFSY
jgi:hypothetical protein